MGTVASQRNSLPIDVETVRMRLGRGGAGERHSLCELRLSHEEWLRLDRWMRDGLDSATLHVNGWHAGLAIFIWITETARRQATTTEIWRTITDQFVNNRGVASELFVRGQPSERLKELLREVAGQMNLRRMPDDGETKWWYETIQLQFGFGFSAIETNLRDWLRGVKPTAALERLLTGPSASTSFSDLWTALLLFRRDRLSEHELRQTLKASPWVLADWHDIIICQTRGDWDAGDDASGDDADGQALTLLTPTGAMWASFDGLRFGFRVEDLVDTQLADPYYDLQINDNFVTRYIRRSDGAFSPDPDEITLPATAPRATVSLVSDEGDQVACDVLEFWDPAADINVFDLAAGRRIPDPFNDPLDQRHLHLLRLGPGLSIESQSTSNDGNGLSCTRYVPFQPGPECRLAVYDSLGFVVWQPLADPAGTGRNEPDWLHAVDVRLVRPPPVVQIGQRVEAEVYGLPPGAVVRSVRVPGGEAVEKRNNVFSFALAPDVLGSAAGAVVSIAVERGSVGNGRERSTIRRKIFLNVGGAAVLVGDRWHCLSCQRAVPVDLLGDSAVRFYLPDWAKSSKGALMEGSVFQGWRGTRATRLRGLHGLGAPLTVQKEPYNCPTDRHAILGGVMCKGIINRVRLDSASGDCTLELRRAIEPAEEHQIVWWQPATGALELLSGTDIESIDEGRQWKLSWGAALEPSCSSIVVVIAYNGSWQGCGLVGNTLALADIAGLHCPEAVAHMTAALARWCRLPVLLRHEGATSPMFAEFAKRYPAAVLTAWLKGSGMPVNRLIFDEAVEWRAAERTALRELYHCWSPTPEQCGAIVTEIGKSNAEYPLFETAECLRNVDPLLMGRVLMTWLRDIGPPKIAKSLRWYLAAMRVALFPNPTPKPNCRSTDERPDERCEFDGHLCEGASGPRCGDYFLCRAARKIIGNRAADKHFVKTLADSAIDSLSGGEVPAEHRDNLLVASHVASFRDYLALRVFERVEAIFS